MAASRSLPNRSLTRLRVWATTAACVLSTPALAASGLATPKAGGSALHLDTSSETSLMFALSTLPLTSLVRQAWAVCAWGRLPSLLVSPLFASLTHASLALPCALATEAVRLLSPLILARTSRWLDRSEQTGVCPSRDQVTVDQKNFSALEPNFDRERLPTGRKAIRRAVKS